VTEDLVKFQLPAKFVIARAWPRTDELAYGWRNGWIDSAALVAIAEQEFSAGLALPPALERLALLLRDQYYEIPQLAVELGDFDDAAARPLWLYLALAWLFAHRDQVEDPLGTIELLYADFDYPAEIEGLVRFMPGPPGVPTGTAAIMARWESYLESRARVFSGREWLTTG
jgi:hypothetical protein